MRVPLSNSHKVVQTQFDTIFTIFKYLVGQRCFGLLDMGFNKVFSQPDCRWKWSVGGSGFAPPRPVVGVPEPLVDMDTEIVQHPPPPHPPPPPPTVWF